MAISEEVVRRLHADGAVAVTPSDGTDLARVGAMLYVGVGGDISLDTVPGDAAVVFKNVPTGSILPVKVKRVRSTSTTATNILALY